jgi:hypothetical protein
MRRPIVSLVRALVAAGCLGLSACGGGDATGPHPGPGPGGDSPAGRYALGAINDSRPGQMVLLSNPGGGAIGLYRFDGSSDLAITDQHTYRLQLRFADEKGSYEYDDRGTVTGTVDQEDGGFILTFESDTYGDSFGGRWTEDGTTTMQYDVDEWRGQVVSSATSNRADQPSLERSGASTS